MTQTHLSGYNEHNIRIGIVMPFEDGYAIPGVYVGGGSACYGGGLPLVKFVKLENAKAYCAMRHPCTAIRWVAEEVEQGDMMNAVRR